MRSLPYAATQTGTADLFESYLLVKYFSTKQHWPWFTVVCTIL